MKSLSRREFSRLMTSAAAATAVAPLGLLNARLALAQTCSFAGFSVPGFGPISPVLPNNTSELVDIPTQGNLVGVPLIALPALFQYTAISMRGQQFSNGSAIPGAHDGMAVFQGRAGHNILVRNHELSIST